MNIYDKIFDKNKEFILVFIVILLSIYIFTSNIFSQTVLPKEGFKMPKIRVPKIRVPKIKFPRIPSPEELFRKALKSVVNPAVNKMKSEVLKAADNVKSAAYKVNDEANRVASKANGVKNQTVDKLNDVTNDIRGFAMRAINFLKNIGKYFANAMQAIVTAITSIGKQTLGILASIMKSVKNMFESLGKGLVTSIIKPFINVFMGLKSIFVGIFGVLMTVVEKIMSLTNCFPVYMFDGMKRMFLYFYNAITPSFIKIIIKFIYNYIIYPMMYVSYYVFLYVPLMIIEFFTGVNIENGLKKSTSKCMKFDIKKPVRKMEDGAKQLIPQFKPLNVNVKFDVSKQTRKINSTLKDAVKKLDPSRIKF